LSAWFRRRQKEYTESEVENNNPSREQKKEQPSRLFQFMSGLRRTREALSDRLSRLVAGKSHLDEEAYDQLEELLIQADVGVPTTLQIVEKVKEKYRQDKNLSPNELPVLIASEMQEVLKVGAPLSLPDGKNRLLYMMVGVNGAGKTTTIGKLAARFKAEGRKVVLGACDTFRAAATEQLEIWAKRADVELISQQEGADPAAVAYDAVNAGKSRHADVIILDTAGRLQNKVNLMRELAKVYNVVKREWGNPPDEVLLVIDATTGQNGLSQAKVFQEATPLTGLVLTKLDGTAKGGIVLAIANEIKIPVKLVGLGEGIEDLREFDDCEYIQALLGNEVQ
jgi:fused signal recognition particle receptor